MILPVFKCLFKIITISTLKLISQSLKNVSTSLQYFYVFETKQKCTEQYASIQVLKYGHCVEVVLLPCLPSIKQKKVSFSLVS